MHRTSLLALAATLSSLAACTGAGDSADPNAHLPPPISAEDQAAVAAVEAGKLAEVETAQGKVTFYEVSPGEFVAKSDFAIDAQMAAIPEQATIVDAFQAVAPGQAIPASITAAMARAQAEPATEVAPVSGLVEETSAGTRLDPAALQSTDGVELRASALASSIDWTWFYNRFCNGYSGPGLATWCMAQAWTNGYARYQAHFGNAVMCGDTGAGRFRLRVSGTTLQLADFGYGQCVSYWYHGPHVAIIGTSLQRTIDYTVDWAENTIRFAGFVKGGDQFVSVPPGL
jgi:hypothetical protein